MERNTLQGKVIAITGSASGIGLAVVRELIILKAKVAIADSQACPQELSNAPDVLFTKVDVTFREEVHNWVQNVVTEFGRLDGMVANRRYSTTRRRSSVRRDLSKNIQCLLYWRLELRYRGILAVQEAGRRRRRGHYF
jgi:NAD(P)-dependent dehydrogenase (short-subunit alcohol dehydrogenase family)